MSHAKVISTTFGVTVAVISSGSTAKEVEKYNMDNEIPFSGKRVELTSKHNVTARDLFHAIHPSKTFDKIDILKIAKTLGIDLGDTWSCYLGGQTHCGECKSCLERRLAYSISDIPDPTVYNTKISKIRDLKHKIGLVSFEKQKVG